MEKDAAKKLVFAALVLAVFAAGAALYFWPKTSGNKTTLNVFAASSFAWVLHENRDMIEQETGLALVIVEAASSTLARQIEEGAPADMFVTADNTWLDYLDERNLTKGETHEITRNGLGLAIDTAAFAGFCTVQFVAQPDAPTLLAACPYTGRMATGDPEFVPLGKYAAEAIDFYQWSFPLAPAPNARSALALFEEGAVPAGIFYATDIESSKKALTWFEIPENSHSPIIYRAVALKDSNDSATENFSNFLKSGTFRTILQDTGFRIQATE